MRKFDKRYAVDALTEILPSENAFRKDVDIRLDALETKQDVIDEAAGEARDRVIRYSEEQIAPRAAALQTLLDAATLEADTIRTAAVAEVRGGVSTSGDTLAKLAAVIDTKAPVLDAVLLGRPTCPTPSISADSGDIVNVTALRQSADAVKAEILGAAPAVIDTIAEAAAALGNDANFSATIFAQLAAKQPLAATLDRKSTRLNSSHRLTSRMPSSA
jgi:phage-related tail fiber protein